MSTKACIVFTNDNAKTVAKEKGMLVSFSDEEILAAVDSVLDEFKDALADFTKTPEKVLRFYIGKVMQKTKGLANPQKTEEFLKDKISRLI